jgi:hypothetical protein
MQWLQALSFLPMLLAARVRRLERRAIRRATDAGATVRERAVLLEDAGRLGELVYRRLERAGVLVPAADDRYYFDPDAYARFQSRRRKRALLAVTALVIGLAIFYLRGDL